MKGFHVVYKDCGKYSAIVYPVSYLNPIEDIKSISMELKKHLAAGSHVLFDLLLANGDNFNRFAEAQYDGSEIKASDIRITELPADTVQELNAYYRGRAHELASSVLSERERERFAAAK